MITAVAEMMVNSMKVGNDPVSTMNSEMKPHIPGKPNEAKKASPVMAEYSGMALARPPKRAISRW